MFISILACLSCGLNSPPSNALSGKWEAGLSNPDGTTALSFTATLTQNGSQVSLTDLNFVNPSSCFGKGTVTTITFVPTDTTHGVTSGSFQMAIQSDPANTSVTDMIVLQGNFVRNSISGTWALTGTGLNCTGPMNFLSGDFVMSQM